MLFALTTGHEIGLAVMGGLFISFALLSSFVFPRFSPDFPTKKGLKWYIPLAVVFFIAMLAAVVTFGVEKKDAAEGGTTAASPYAGGDVAVGKATFVSATCSACHVFTPAGSTAKVGPNLDDLAADAKQAGQTVIDFTGSAIVSPPPKYVPPGYPKNAMPTTFGTSLTPAQIAGLVAYLTTPSA